MSLFKRLKTDCLDEWQAYTRHAFVEGLASGSLPEVAFRKYLEQDYLFLIQFSRAYALAVYKAPTLADMKQGLAGLKTILETEMELHVELCAGWGLTRDKLEQAEEASATMAYTRYVLESGMSGDLLDLQVALAPCILGYAEIGAERARAEPFGASGDAYRRWIAEYASVAYQEAAGEFAAWMNETAEVYLTEARYASVKRIFSKATRLEADFWQMGLAAVTEEKPQI